MEKPEYEYLGVKIPKKLKNEVTAAVARGDYLNQSDLIRAALRNLLDHPGAE